MLKLNSLRKVTKKRKTIGRGGSRGGTSGRGGKGQTARSGGSTRVGFEGGQTPLYRRLPKRGFTNNPFATDVMIVNLSQLNDSFASGDEVTREQLLQKGLIRVPSGSKGASTKIKVLGKGELTKRLVVEADAFSKSAAQAITDKGGEARLTKET